MGDDDCEQIRDALGQAVNMTASELEQWLDTDESQSVGQKKNGGDSTGHESGRETVTLLRTKVADLSGDDLTQMKRVHGYVARHLEQKPDKSNAELEHIPWRYSLMNWGTTL